MSRKALIVDADASSCRQVANFLQQEGFEPAVLHDGKAALAWARSTSPDVVFLSQQLPDRAGHTLCRDLKLDRRSALTPLIMIASAPDHDGHCGGLEVQADHYLSRPLSDESLKHVLDHALAARDQATAQGCEAEIHFRLQSETPHLEQLNDLVGSLCLANGLSPRQVRQFGRAVYELGKNAMEWGHRNEVDRIVTVIYRADQERISLTIRDTGPGFNPGHLPHAAQADDPISHLMVREGLGLREGGFGIMIARGLVDECRYNERGNEVRIVKRLGPDTAVGTHQTS